MLEYLKVILTPHVIWGLIFLLFIFRFKKSFELIFKAISKKIKSVKTIEKTSEGIKTTFEERQSKKEIEVNVTNAPEEKNASESIWSEDKVEDVAQLRTLVKAERQTRYLWEYRYLNHFLVRKTQIILDWLAESGSPQSITFYQNAWLQLIPEPEERNAILNALQAHHLIELSPADSISLTPKGREYHDWRGVLPKLEAVNESA
jgi:hypothetical protein